MSACHGNGPDHCCYLEGVVCSFLERGTEPGRRWTCGLKRKYGNWEDVHNSPEYVETVKPVWEDKGIKDCGDFGPAEQQCCFGDWPKDRFYLIRSNCISPPQGRFDERGE